ncbi:hypothetical protein [Streptacidiphilus anmyonensis]|uniref:hypothetical protein n=1 Tax=Streptacidiphilus anmyonensis TaxID=405782 RepID=UPI0005A66120|nr:hypothetical protein [Streptacidiphilus anmyonensis]
MPLPVYEPFHQSDRPYLMDSVLEGESDWALARLALNKRSFARYDPDPRADEAQEIGKLFTADEAKRVDAFLAASLQDTDRLDAIADTWAVTGDDLKWLIAELRQAWQRLDRFRDRIDNSGSLADTGYLSSAVDYIHWSRKPQALSPCPAPA